MSIQTPEGTRDVVAAVAQAAAATAPAHAAGRVGHVEQHGIEHIPASERHGRPSSLFWVWISANVG
jgi:hypothetical protein